MRRARRRALLAILLAALALGLTIARTGPEPLPPRPPGERPTLLLLTSLPLMFGDAFSLHETGSPALEALERRYEIVPISLADPSELAKGRLLLMAQPLAQPAEDLVALDRWVRSGGRVLILADPLLEWPSERPLGDPLRPPPMFMDTGLLAHWGLRLEGPGLGGRGLGGLGPGGSATRKLGGFNVLTRSPGELSGRCRISPDRLVADCHVGRGEARIVADADLLDEKGLGAGARHNLDGLLAELWSVERR